MRAAVFAALAEAERDKNTGFGTGHLLRGIAGGEGARLLSRLGLTPEQLEAVLRITELPGPGRTTPALTVNARAALDRVYREAAELGDNHIGPEHLLLALTRFPDSDAGRALAGAGITLSSAAREIMRTQA